MPIRLSAPQAHMGEPVKLGYDASDGLKGGLGNLRGRSSLQCLLLPGDKCNGATQA